MIAVHPIPAAGCVKDPQHEHDYRGGSKMLLVWKPEINLFSEKYSLMK